MHLTNIANQLTDRISEVLTGFAGWLNRFGETSWDYQSFFAGPMGGRAKALYYRDRLIGTVAVAPMIFCLAFLPWARSLFHLPLRFPLPGPHYAIGLACHDESTVNH